MATDPAEWTEDGGSWEQTVSSLVQSSTSGVTRCYRESGLTDFVAHFKFTVEEKGSEGGEAKFVYSNADANEDYRVDFMHRLDACRVTAGRWAGFWALELIPGREYSARIRVRANIVRVDVDDLPIVPGFNFGKRSDGKIGFGTWQTKARFEDLRIEPYEQRRCFVIMPFDEKRNLLYEDVLRPALDSHPDYVFDFTRADKALTVGKITEEIDEFIDKADVLIADITESNPNVYYELGYGHAGQRKALLLAEDVPELQVPFDIKDFRHHRYQFTRAGLDELRSKVQEILSNIVKSSEES